MCEIPGRNASTKQSCGTAAELYKRLELSLRNISMYGTVTLPDYCAAEDHFSTYGTVTLPDYCAAEVHFASGSLDRKNRSGSLRIISMCGTIILLAGHRVDARAWHSSITLHARCLLLSYSSR